MSPTFQPPTVNDVPRVLPDTRGVEYLLARHFSELARGRSVVKISGTYTTVDNPANDQLVGTEGVDFFLGGHIYNVTDAVATALTADGFTVGTTEWGELTGLWSEYASTTWGTL